MKIIEAMNELKLTEKKLSQRLAFIQRYAARPSFRDDAFGGAESAKVAQAVQSANDLIAQHEAMKRAIDYTNLMTNVTVAGKEYSIHSLILHKRFLLKLKSNVVASLNDQQAKAEVAQLMQRGGTEQKVNAQVVYNYNIQEKEDQLTKLAEMASSIDSTLQIANAQLDLKEAPRG